MQKHTKFAAVATIGWAAGLFTGTACSAGLSDSVAFDIQPQALDAALLEFSKQAGIQVFGPARGVIGKTTPGVQGELVVEQALKSLLKDSGLRYKLINSHTIAIGAAGADDVSLQWSMLSAPTDGATTRDSRLANNGSLNKFLLAQENGDSATGTRTAAEKPPVLEEIIVSAQKRIENLQSVPVSAQVIGSQALNERNHNSLEELTQTVPAVHVSSGARSNILSVRGISSGQNNAFDQSVAMFSDDIYHGRSRMSNATFLDLDRIEILKGPQSTFFGNNAIAGALNIVSKKPGDRFEGWTRALYGMYGQYAIEGAAGGPITDTFGLRIAGTYNGMDGWLENVTTGQHVPTIDNKGGRLTAAFKPTDEFDAILKVETGYHKITGTDSDQPAQWNQCPPPRPFTDSGCDAALAQGAPIGLDNDKTVGFPGTLNRLATVEDVLTLNYRKWGHEFTSVTGYYKYNFDWHAGNLLSVPTLTWQLPENYRQFSQELRVASPAGQQFEYLFGAYFQTDRLRQDQENNLYFVSPIVTSLAGPIPALAPLLPYLPLAYMNGIEQHEHVYSLFGSLDWNVTDRLKISAGLRASRVKKDYTAHFHWGSTGAAISYGGFVPLPTDVEQLPQILFSSLIPRTGGSSPLTQSDQAWMPSARFQYQLNPDVMAYFRYDRGFLAGGFNGVDVYDLGNVTEFGPEHVNAYELGLKSKWLDDRVLVNLDVFRSDYTDLQVDALVYVTVAGVSGFTGKVANAAAARSQGVELETQWAVTRDLRLGANVTYLDAHYVDYTNAPPGTLQGTCIANYTLPECGQFPNPPPAVADLSGQSTAYAPKWSGSITATYTLILPRDYRFTTEFNPYFSTSYFTGSGDSFSRVGGYARLDGRLSLETADGRWTFDVIGKNLTDRIIVTRPGLSSASKQPPRTIAAQIRYNFAGR